MVRLIAVLLVCAVLVAGCVPAGPPQEQEADSQCVDTSMMFKAGKKKKKKSSHGDDDCD